MLASSTSSLWWLSERAIIVTSIGDSAAPCPMRISFPDKHNRVPALYARFATRKNTRFGEVPYKLGHAICCDRVTAPGIQQDIKKRQPLLDRYASVSEGIVNVPLDRPLAFVPPPDNREPLTTSACGS